MTEARDEVASTPKPRKVSAMTEIVLRFIREAGWEPFFERLATLMDRHRKTTLVAGVLFVPLLIGLDMAFG